MKKIIIHRYCRSCNKYFNPLPGNVRKGGGNYCSNKCRSLGLWSSPKYRDHMSRVHKGQMPTNITQLIALSKSDEGRRRMSEQMKGKRMNEENPMWRGDRVSYSGLHAWVKVRLAKPLGCNHCGEVKPLDLANKSHEYERNIEDWFWLCKPCHKTYDKGRRDTRILFNIDKDSHVRGRRVT